MASPSAVDLLGPLVRSSQGSPSAASLVGGAFTPALATAGGFAQAGVFGAPGTHHASDHAGILGAVGHVLSQGATDLKDVALGMPAGLYEMAKATAQLATGDPDAAKRIAEAFVTQTIEDIRHPLRHPGYTLLDLLPIVSGGAGAVARVGEAGRAAAIGEDAARAFLRNPAKNVREITAPSGASAKGHYSRSGLGYVTQRATDKALMKRAARGGTPGAGGKAETLLNKRIEKWTTRQLRVERAVLDSKVTKLAAATAKLDPAESRALRLAFEKLAVSERLAADTQRVQEAQGRVGSVPGADPRTVKRLQDREQWGRDALQHLDVGPDGLATLKADGPEADRLNRIFGMMHEVYGDRETILKALNVMDEAALEAAKLKIGRYSLGAHWVEPTPARVGRSPGVLAATKRADSLQRRFDALHAREQPGSIISKDRVLNQKEAEQHLAELNLTHDKALKAVAESLFGPVNKTELAQRNALRGKLKRQHARTSKSLTLRGFGAPKLVLPETLWQERFRLAQEKLDETIAANPDHPVMQRWAERQDEIARLSEALNPSPEEVFGTGPRAKRQPIKVSEEAVKGSSAQLMRLGAATGVAKEDLATARARAAHHLTETGVVGAEHLTLPPDAGFIGYPRRVSIRQPQVKVSSTGTIGHTRDESLRASRGETIRYGLDEPNVGKILASRGHAANKLKILARRVELARKGGTSVPTRADDVFVWNDGEILSQDRIPPDVKDYLADSEKFKTPEEEQSIIDQARSAWIKPDWQLGEAGQYLEAAAAGKGVFVHRAVLGDLGKPLPTRIQGNIASLADATNNVQKSLLIYLKANYPLIQALSNTGMNLIQQGFAAPKNIARAGVMMRRNPELAAQMGDVMGTGALMTLAFEGAGRTALATQKLAHWMSGWVDGPARLSAFLHEAGKAGYTTDAELRALLTDESKVEELGQVAQRAKEAIVMYDDLGDTEKNLIRRMFFVYPWLKGSTKWTAHFLRDHPIQASVLGRVGAIGMDASRREYPSMPSYLQGAFQGPGGGLINPSGVNQLQTPVQIATALAGLATGSNTAPELAGFLTPALGTAVSLGTGRNTIGIPLKGSLPARLRQLLVEPAPAVQGLRSLAHLGVGDQAILNALLGEAKGSKTFPNLNDPLFRFWLGGLYPRETSQAALARNAALEKTGR